MQAACQVIYISQNMYRSYTSGKTCLSQPYNFEAPLLVQL